MERLPICKKCAFSIRDCTLGTKCPRHYEIPCDQCEHHGCLNLKICRHAIAESGKAQSDQIAALQADVMEARSVAKSMLNCLWCARTTNKFDCTHCSGLKDRLRKLAGEDRLNG